MNEKETEKKLDFFKKDKKNTNIFISGLKIALFSLFISQVCYTLYDMEQIDSYVETIKTTNDNVEKQIKDYRLAIMEGNQAEILNNFIKIKSSNTVLGDSVANSFVNIGTLNRSLAKKDYKLDAPTLYYMKEINEKEFLNGYEAEKQEILNIGKCSFSIVGCYMKKEVMEVSLDKIEKIKNDILIKNMSLK